MFAGRKVKLNPGTVDLVQFMGLVITIKTVMPNDKNMRICYLVEPLKMQRAPKNMVNT